MQVGPCVPVGIQLEKAGVGPTSGPTWYLFSLGPPRTEGQALPEVVISGELG
jgi:hypothetical protein